MACNLQNMTESAELVARRVRGALAENQVRKIDAASWLGISTNSLGRRLGGDIKFRRPELEVLANRLGVPIERFTED